MRARQPRRRDLARKGPAGAVVMFYSRRGAIIEEALGAAARLDFPGAAA